MVVLAFVLNGCGYLFFGLGGLAFYLTVTRTLLGQMKSKDRYYRIASWVLPIAWLAMARGSWYLSTLLRP